MAPEIVDDREKPSPDWTRPPEPPIHRASRKGDIDALAKLIAEGADVDERADLEHDNGPHLNGLTTLMVAARSIDGATVETLRWLVAHGADVRAESKGGNSAAWYAAGHGGRWEFHAKAITPDHVERLRYLLDLGLDPTECNFIGRSLLTEACQAGDPARVALLLERGAPPTPPAAQSPKTVIPVQERLKAAGLGPDEETPAGDHDSFQIPLMCAASSGSADCVRLILDAGVDVNTRDSSGQTALMVAGSPEVVRLLLKSGADLHATDSYGGDAFEKIVEGSCCGGVCGPERFDVARALVEAGIDIERIDKWGKTRLASAAFGIHADTVEFLLKLGARADARDLGGETPLHSICWQGEYTGEESKRNCERIIRTLVAAGVSVAGVDDQGQTAMHRAAGGDWGNATAIRTLLELGAKPDPVDEEGTTPIMIAASNAEIDCIQLLCDAGADPTRKDAEGRSALDLSLDHLESWRGIVAIGPDANLVEFQRKLNEELTAEYGGNPDSPTDVAALIKQQSDRHAAALESAQRAFDLLKQFAERRGSGSQT